MATRRVKSTTNTNYIQSLKVDCINDYLTNNYSSVLFSKKHKGEEFISPKLTIQFDSNNLDGIHICGYLSKDFAVKTAASCSLNIYQISNDGLCTKTLITSVLGIESNKMFKKSLTSIELAPVELSGDVTLLIEATFLRRDKTFKKSIYVNHLGIFDSFFRLKQHVDFIDLTKVDE